MKHLLPLHPARSLVLLGCLLALSYGPCRAQAPVAQQLDVFFGETKLLPIDRPIESFSVVPEGIVKVAKVESAPNELSLVGMAGGSAVLTIKSDGRTLVYALAVSPAPERLYINLNESKRLTFPDPIDDTSISQQGIVHVVQPDTGNPETNGKVLLVEALFAGKTTLTVTCKGQLYRYFISTFENRGADILEIQNSFSAKGYRNLTIAFDKDQAIISGTVPTQEELDDAVRIVKQFTNYVVVKATLGQEVELSEYSEQESIIINNIQRIANVKGLTIRVKFPLPSVITTSTYTKSTGDYIAPTVTTTPQGGTVRSSGFQPPPESQQGPNSTGPTELKPQQNVTQTVTTTENTSVPEKVFLYGDLQDDLEEAKVIRVARTFCPFIVSFLTVKDPIQLRTQIRFIQFKGDGSRNTGFDWSGGGSGPTITLGVHGATFPLVGIPGTGIPNPISAFVNFITTSGNATGAVSATAILHLYETLNLAKLTRENDLFLTNGQTGWYSEGEVLSYVGSATTTATSTTAGVTTLAATSVFLGVNMDIAPLNLTAAGGTEPAGQKIFGIPSSVGSGSSSFTLTQDSSPPASNVTKLAAPIQQSGSIPVVDNTVKYVDENGLIGMDISTQLTVPKALPFTTIAAGFGDAFLTLPDFFVRTTRTRVNLRDGQSVVINGLIDKEVTKTITQIPFFAKIPIFSALFKNTTDGNTNEQVVVLVTPHIIRMRDPNSARYPKPMDPEIQDMARAWGDVPIIKPVRYDARAVDLRPESPKDMKDAKSANTPSEPPPLAPHASGGMQTLQPPAESASAAPQAVDKTPPASDISRQPSSAPLAPSSTLP